MFTYLKTDVGHHGNKWLLDGHERAMIVQNIELMTSMTVVSTIEFFVHSNIVALSCIKHFRRYD